MKKGLRILVPLALMAGVCSRAQESVPGMPWTGVPRPSAHIPITPPPTGKLFDYTAPEVLRPIGEATSELSTFSASMAQYKRTCELPPLPSYSRQWTPELEFGLQKVQPDIFSAVPLGVWDSGMVYATASRQSLPGLMGIERGAVGAAQTFGNVSVSASMFAEKYATFASLQTIYGMNAALDWRITDRLSLHAFGEFTPGRSLARYIGSAPGVSPAMRSYVAATSFGGYMSVDISRRFGIDVGARGMYNFATGRYEAIPIAAPYVRLNNGAKIGVDAGGIIYQLLRGASGRNWRPQNPTIGAPIPMGPPPVR